MGAPPARAQSVVVSAPSTDVTKKGVLMLAHESQLNLWSYDKPYWNSFSFTTYGLTEEVELAATLYGVGSPPSGNVTLALGYKQRIALAPRSEWQPTVVFGPMFPISLSGRRGPGIWAYSAASFRLPRLRTRFTAGPSYGTAQIFGSDVLCAFAAIEQPILENVLLVADWFSGRHDLGALVPAVQWNVSHAFIVIAGVKIPNSSIAGPVSPLVELTYDFDAASLFAKREHGAAEASDASR